MQQLIIVAVFFAVLNICLAQSLTINGGGAASVPAGTDFATSSYQNAWDYNERTDFNNMFTQAQRTSLRKKNSAF